MGPIPTSPCWVDGMSAPTDDPARPASHSKWEARSVVRFGCSSSFNAIPAVSGRLPISQTPLLLAGVIAEAIGKNTHGWRHLEVRHRPSALFVKSEKEQTKLYKGRRRVRNSLTVAIPSALLRPSPCRKAHHR